MKIKIIFTIIVPFFITIFPIFAQKNKISAKDFDVLVGSWKGTLTYLDYSSGKPYTMPADIEVKKNKKDKSFVIDNIYPDEPKANSSYTMVISQDGKLIDKESVKSRRKLDDGNLEIITEKTEKDGNDNKPAIIRHTYIVGKNIFSKRKEILFEGTKEWIKRHEYNYTKK